MGSGEQFSDIQSALDQVSAGDVVEVMGGQTYSGTVSFRPEHGGSPGNPVTVRGVPVGGQLPVIQGFGSGQWDTMVVFLNANHFVLDGFEIIGDGNEENSCIIHKADQVVVRNVVVHECGRHGLLGTDDDSGSLTVEYSEFYSCGGGLYHHQIYMATDESAYPGSVFRLQHSYIHDGNGGNNVKSRAERNEIYFNWIQNAVFHELDLIGPDGGDPDLAREDSDVVGNVLIKNSEWRIARIGGDGTGSTGGRYRFVNNTMILGDAADRAIDLQQGVDSLEMHNNVLFRSAGPARVWRHNDAEGSAIFIGSNNWVQAGWTDIPAEWTGTLFGADPGFMDLSSWDLRLADGSPLIDQGSATTAQAGAHEFPNPLREIGFVPPVRARADQAQPREAGGPLDIGAFEVGTGEPPPDAGGGSGQGGAAQGGSGQGASGQGGAAGSTSGARSSGSDDSGCGCRTAGSRDQELPLLALGVPLLGVALRRRRRS